MITPRRTRLIRVADLHEFRQTIVSLVDARIEAPRSDSGLPARVVIVPTRSAATTLARTLPARAVGPSVSHALVTRDELYDVLHARLGTPPRRLNAFERDAIAQAAAHEAAAHGELPFKIRPGLVAEILRFYDQLRRQSQSVKRFEELIVEALGGGDLDDRGAQRLIQQTRFLADTFRAYERRVVALDALDEHRLRDRLMCDVAAIPLLHVVVTVSDWIADPSGLYVADFDLLNRLPNLATVDLVATGATLDAGFHERLHRWWPGIEETDARAFVGGQALRPRLVVPVPEGDAAPLWFTHRDREEELISVARRLVSEPPPSFDSVAIVFKRPLPYLYLAQDTLGSAAVPFVISDALPLAAEPVAAALDLILDVAEADFARDSLIALLRSPHWMGTSVLSGPAVAALDRVLSEARYLGGPERLLAIADASRQRAGEVGAGDARLDARPALDVAVALVADLSFLSAKRSASLHLADLLRFVDRHLTILDPAHPQYEREVRARGAVLGILQSMTAACHDHHDPSWTAADLATSVRRWIGDATFLPASDESGVRLLDDQAARYGVFHDVTIVGLVENEWPERPRRTIFYSPTLLKALGWPSETERHGASDARFRDLLASALARVELSVFMLDDEAIVSRSVQLDDVSAVKLSTTTRDAHRQHPLLPQECLALEARPASEAGSATQAWFNLRAGRTSAADHAFHGSTGAVEQRIWSVSALETYLACPFKFFAQHVLRLEEEPDDDEVMDPRMQGQFVHDVFETFFREWQDEGYGGITAENIQDARRRFAAIVDQKIQRLPEGEAGLERTRLLGSPATAGLGEAVFRMEAERAVPVVARLLEHKLEGPLSVETSTGSRTVAIRGKADRLDLLADGTFRLIDYKLGWPPDRGRALQLPIYALCAEQQLKVQGRSWALAEAVYLAFKGPKRVVPLFSNDASRDETLLKAQQRLADTVDAIERGEFPPAPDDVYRCDSCSFSAVCRKDYVGDL